MMKLFAKKPCSFGGRKFYIGNEIPTNMVLDPKAQEKMGILAVVEEESSNAAPDEGGPLLPPSSTLECDAEENVASQATYTKSALSRMNKADLLKLAFVMGVEAIAEMPKDTIADLILEKQG